MERGILVRRLEMDCPLCDKVHEVEERKRLTTIVIKGEEVTYEERFYFCANADEDENEFETGAMTNDNLLNARNAYRKKRGLLTSEEIVAIRKTYGLSQVDLARLLGWGEATISRYESKAIQDESYDMMLRMVQDNPVFVMELFEKNEKKFADEKRVKLYSRITEKLRSRKNGELFLKRFEELEEEDQKEVLNLIEFKRILKERKNNEWIKTK